MSGGLLYAWAAPPLPVALGRTLQGLGTMALPLALLGIGGSMVSVPVRGHLGFASLASLLKVALAPLAGLTLARLLGASPMEIRLVLVFLACPTATASYIMAHQLDGDEALAASSVVLSSALSLISLAAALALT